MNEQEKFFRDVLSEVQSMRKRADRLRDIADYLEGGAERLANKIEDQAEKLGIEIPASFQED